MAKQPIPAKFDWYVPPGEMLEDYLEDREKTPQALAQHLGVSESYVQDLLSCKEMMTVETAKQIAVFLNMSEYYWVDTVTGYEEFLAKKQDQQTVEQWVKQFPYKELVNLGLVEPARKIADKITELQKYLGIGDDFKTGIDDFLSNRNLAYRQSDSANNSLTKAIYIKYGENQYVKQLDFPLFDKEALFRIIPELCALVILQPQDYSAQLKSRLKEVGVCLVYVSQIKGLKVKGVTNGYNRNPIVQVSIGTLREDSFWFTLFHELGHIILHDERLFWDEDEKNNYSSTNEETEANQFAAEKLLPADIFSLRNPRLSFDEVKRFAHQNKTKPCIVVGRLHYEGIKDWGWGTPLIQKLLLKDDILSYA